jgi:hypothetical protein
VPSSRSERVFRALSDEWLDDIACAMDSAAGEGAFGNDDLVVALRDEYKRRGRQIPMAYSDRRVSPDEWNIRR